MGAWIIVLCWMDRQQIFGVLAEDGPSVLPDSHESIISKWRILEM